MSPPRLAPAAFRVSFPEFGTADELLIEAKIAEQHALWQHQEEVLGADAYDVALGYRVALELSRSPFGTNARLEQLVPIYEKAIHDIVARIPGSPLVIRHGPCP